MISVSYASAFVRTVGFVHDKADRAVQLLQPAEIAAILRDKARAVCDCDKLKRDRLARGIVDQLTRFDRRLTPVSTSRSRVTPKSTSACRARGPIVSRSSRILPIRDHGCEICRSG